MPTYRVMIEKRIDVEADNEDEAKAVAIAYVDVEDCIAWENESEADRRGTAAGY